MLTNDVQLPDAIPMLSRGKHRNPRKGACFMELASFLAGEPWSDRPACTHPLLADVARLVNDHISDTGRQGLVDLIPSVIGLADDDLRVDARIALRLAVSALPVVAAERQCVLAVSVLSSSRMLVALGGLPTDALVQRSHAALNDVPRAARWAEDFTRGLAPSPVAFRRRIAPGTVRHAVAGVAVACVPDPDSLLRQLLVGAIEECAASGRVVAAAPSALRVALR